MELQNGVCTVCGHSMQAFLDLCIQAGADPGNIDSLTCPRCSLMTQDMLDDVWCDLQPPIKVGTAVRCRDTGVVGKVIYIEMSSTPFRVKFPDEEYSDWYSGDQLERIADSRPSPQYMPVDIDLEDYPGSVFVKCPGCNLGSHMVDQASVDCISKMLRSHMRCPPSLVKGTRNHFSQLHMKPIGSGVIVRCPDCKQSMILPSAATVDDVVDFIRTHTSCYQGD